MTKVKLALVSYLNTIPFIEGIKANKELSQQLELVVDYPSKCAEYIRNGAVDGGLIPVGALQEQTLDLVTNFCIGSNGKVRTVVLLSHQNFSEVNTIYLDYQSATSVRLVKVLAQHFWKRTFEFLPTRPGFENQIPPNSAILVIGDRVFELEKKYPFVIDLAEEWTRYTHLPFAFAVWVGNEKVKAIEPILNQAFEQSMQNITSYTNNLSTIDQQTFIHYLTQNIDYTLNFDKKEAIRLFTSLLVTCS